MGKKHKSILDRAKDQARSIRNEATMQATQAAAVSKPWELFENFIYTIYRAFKQPRKKK